ncbi:MAG TPA: rhodanese-like domain-containing protein [Lachnospiraceae bacterium]|nr:rhodanese-like domain-containing protein [Lachnospiraceae bacterium]
MKNKGIIVLICLIVAIVLLLAYNKLGKGQADEVNTYISVSAEEAKEYMDKEENYIILDVRTQEEYDAGYIPGAILIPDFEIADRAEKELPDKDQLILVYCRSGNRSKKASAQLVAMGYTNVVEFGGINDWPYEVVTD